MKIKVSNSGASNFKIESISFRNYKPFKNWQKFKPAALNILIGPNNSGKSSFVEFLSLLNSQGFPDSLKVEHKKIRGSVLSKMFVDKDKPLEVKIRLNYNEENSQGSVTPGKTMISSNIEYLLGYEKMASENSLQLVSLDIKDYKTGNLIVAGAPSKTTDNYIFNFRGHYSKYLKKCLESGRQPFVDTSDTKRNDDYNFIDLIETDLVFLDKKDPKKKKEENYLLDFLSDLNFTAPSPFEAADYRLWGLLPEASFSKNSTRFSDHMIINNYDSLEKKTYKYGSEPHNWQFPNILDLENLASNRGIKDNRGRRIDYNYRALGFYLEYYFDSLEKMLSILKTLVPTIDHFRVNRLEQKEMYTEAELSEYGYQFSSEDMKRWLQKFTIADDIIKEKITEEVFFILLKRGKKKIHLHQLGYGSTQIFLIILFLFKASLKSKSPGLSRDLIKYAISPWPSGGHNLFYLEEPESNLHPKFQSLISDLLVETVNTRRANIIVETHSEYLVRKLQYLVAKKEILPEDVSINYFEDVTLETGTGKIREIRMRPDGFLMEDFGKGFFDEAARWTFELFHLQGEN